MKNTVLLAGARSQIGLYCIAQLRAKGLMTLALTRRLQKSPTPSDSLLRWIQADALAASERTDDINYLISAGPLAVGLDCLKRCRGLRRAVMFSTSSIHTREPELATHYRHLEQQVQQQCERRGIALLLLRPTLVYGCGLDRNISLLAAFGARFGFIPISRAAQGKRQPVHAEDLAEAALTALTAEQAINLQGELCGGSCLSYRQMVERTAAAQTKEPRVVRIPAGLLSAGLRLARLIPRWNELRADMVSRQAEDFVFDDSTVRRQLGVSPRAFDPQLEDFSPPPGWGDWLPAGLISRSDGDT